MNKQKKNYKQFSKINTFQKIKKPIFKLRIISKNIIWQFLRIKNNILKNQLIVLDLNNKMNYGKYMV